MASKEEYRGRNFKNRGIGEKILNKDGSDGGLSGGLSTKLPKPNILRIEVLDGNARQRYLAAVQRKGDELREELYDHATIPGERVFYGFLVPGSETGFSLSTQWSKQTGSGAILGELKGLAGAVPGVNKLVGGASDVLDRIGDIGGSLLGVNKSTTGSGTAKDFESVNLQDYHLKCGWYLPEQYHLCIKSLKTIYRMAYPKQTDVNTITEMMENTINHLQEGITKKVNESSQVNDDGTISTGVKKVIGAGANAVVDVAGNVLTKSASTIMNIQEDFGSNYTFNPLPVRVSVGQYMDIEPLVITNVNTTFSKETFINYSGKEKGRHLPITATVDISFEYWLNPAPDLQFTSLLGQELFGVAATPRKSTVPKGDDLDSNDNSKYNLKSTAPVDSTFVYVQPPSANQFDVSGSNIIKGNETAPLNEAELLRSIGAPSFDGT